MIDHEQTKAPAVTEAIANNPTLYKDNTPSGCDCQTICAECRCGDHRKRIADAIARYAAKHGGGQ